MYEGVNGTTRSVTGVLLLVGSPTFREENRRPAKRLFSGRLFPENRRLGVDRYGFVPDPDVCIGVEPSFAVVVTVKCTV